VIVVCLWRATMVSRAVAAGFRGCATLRTAWEAACLADAAEQIRRSQVRERGYARPMRLEQPFRVC